MSDVENSDGIIGYTLFGDPVYRDRRTRGRPPFEWKAENSHKVSMLLAMGWKNDRIAKVIIDPRSGKPISVPTLKRYFRFEMSVREQARDQLISKQLMKLAEMFFERDNVGAGREFQRMVEKNDMALADRRIRDAQDVQTPPEKLGKKERAVKDAAEIAEGGGGSWGDDLKPGMH
ncbi:hypothetical protein [Pseudooceanicola nitratireducens]|uniref:hypothetical protein n=1 Tax=Pseudooceanicola nitratireducens TaxID=517719 RepID=UPI0023F13039|nr:hypothetical protein [Pseudooceanicola nitratireducens]